jgi:hypothetical protein
MLLVGSFSSVISLERSAYENHKSGALKAKDNKICDIRLRAVFGVEV